MALESPVLKNWVRSSTGSSRISSREKNCFLDLGERLFGGVHQAVALKVTAPPFHLQPGAVFQHDLQLVITAIELEILGANPST